MFPGTPLKVPSDPQYLISVLVTIMETEIKIFVFKGGKMWGCYFVLCFLPLQKQMKIWGR